MDSSSQFSAEPMALDAPAAPPRKGQSVLAWIVIGLVVGVIIGGRTWQEHASPAPANAEGPSSRSVVLELQSRYIVGLHHYLGPFIPTLPAEVAKMNRGGIDERLRAIILLGEMLGPLEAIKRLDELDDLRTKSGVTPSASQQRSIAILHEAYWDFADKRFNVPNVPEADRAYLEEELGWFGLLALHPKTPDDEQAPGRHEAMRLAGKTALVVVGATCLVVLFVCVGFAGVVTFIVLAWNGSITWRLHTGLTHGGVYAETFALWLIYFFATNLMLAFVPIDIPRIPQAIGVFFSSLITLAWPVIRGIPWRQVREDIGLTCTGNPLGEIAAGVWCYIVNLPLVALGFGMTVGMLLLRTKLQEAGDGAPESFVNEPMPTHPILQYLADGEWAMLAQIFVLACIAAPVVEEIMFRGVLHRHYREVSAHWRPVYSALFSTTIVSFIFAAVHPQGLIVIPPLMFMAYGFSLAREWRGCLLGSMFAHGMSNGMVLTVATLALSK